MTDGCLGLRPCFAGLDALVPSVIELGVTSTCAVSEPRPAATATTDFVRFRDDTAFGAHGTYGRRRSCWCVHVDIGQITKRKIQTQLLVALCDDLSRLRWLGLTFAGIDTL